MQNQYYVLQTLKSVKLAQIKANKKGDILSYKGICTNNQTKLLTSYTLIRLS